MTELGSLLASNTCGSVEPVSGWLAQLKPNPLDGEMGDGHDDGRVHLPGNSAEPPQYPERGEAYRGRTKREDLAPKARRASWLD